MNLTNLTIREDTDIVSVQSALHQLADVFKHPLLRGAGAEHVVKLKVVGLD